LEKLGSKQPRVFSVWVHRTVRCTGLSGAPDSVRCARLAAVNWLLSRLRRWCTAINHWTVRWCTGLFGEPTVGPANGRPRNPRATRGRANGQKGAPDSVRCANCSETLTVGFTKEGKKSAPDCPVRQATEGRNCLPGMLSTAPSCLGAIKGTPRRMEEYTKHSLSIPKHQDFNSSHSILCDSN
jgi:hypothetical protein